MMASPLGRWLAAGAFALALIVLASVTAYFVGRSDGAAGCEWRWQAKMSAEQTRQAYARAQALDAAVARELARAAENEILEKKVSDYEAELAREPAQAGGFDCRLRPADLERLRLLRR
jgi:hypothetical protein